MTLEHDLANWAREWRGAMLRFAQLHLNRREDAEDAVQDTLCAALTVDSATLAGIDPKRYLFGILKNKVMDRLRQKYRSELGFDEAFEDDIDEVLFDGGGRWVPAVAPRVWDTPAEQLQTTQFFKVVDICVNDLPTKPARVFSMKEFLDCDADEICSTLGLSKTDYWQCLSRARKQIQLCLNQRWFEGERRATA